MLKKILSIITLTVIAAPAAFINPLGINFRSIDTGGTLNSIDAYSDGVGVFLSGNNELSDFNSLVFKYGNSSKELNIGILDYIILSGNGTTQDIALANKLKVSLTPVVVLPSYNNTCSGGFGGTSVNTNIRCNYLGLTTLDSGWLNLKSMLEWKDLSLANNDLRTLSNLENLTYTTYLDLQYNLNLTSLTGLNPNLKIGPTSGSGGYLYIDHTSLASIEILRTMDLSSLEELSVHNIPTLNDISPLVNISNPVTVIYFDQRDYTGKLPANSYLCTTGYANNQLKANTGSWPAPKVTKSFVCAP